MRNTNTDLFRAWRCVWLVAAVGIAAGCADPMQKAALADKAGRAAEAIQWYTKAADAGDAEAQFQMGERLRIGKGIARNPEASMAWYLKAANQGHVAAQAYSGLFRMGLEGATVHLDYTEALRWLKPAAEAGNPLAQVGLAYMNE